jgi:hypothetical protein
VDSTFKGASMRAILALIMLLLSSVAALAADPIFPPGSTIGMAPPSGMVLSPNFSGFHDDHIGGVIVLTKFPAIAFDQVVAGGLDDAKLATGGIVLLTRENVMIGGNPALLLTGRQVIRGVNFRYWGAVVSSPYATALVNAQYPEATATPSYDQAIRAALNSITFRPEPSLGQQVAALPFTLPDLGKFRVVVIISGRIVGLTDGPNDSDTDDTQTQMLVAVSQQVPPDEFRQSAARQEFQNQGRRMQVVGVDSESYITIGELPAYQTIGRIRDEKGTELKTVQWMIFNDNKTLLMNATSRPERFDLIWPQIVTIRDGIRLKQSP